MDEGKRFESNFEESCKILEQAGEVGITRLYDPVGGFKGIANICDYIIARKPHTFYFELKARSGKRINFKGSISPTQYEGLWDKSGVDGCIAGVIFKYLDFQIAIFVDIRDIDAMEKDGHKSITLEQAKSIGVILEGTLKRTNTDYDVIPFLDNLSRRYHYVRR